jgi:D-alanyl-D-alanine carboxypeptidase
VLRIGGPLRVLIPVLLLALLLMPASRLSALEANYSETSFEAMVGHAIGPMAPRVSVTKSSYQQAEGKKTPKAAASIERRPSAVPPHPRSPLAMRTRDQKPQLVPTTKQAVARSIPRGGTRGNGSTATDGLAVTSMILQSGAFSGASSDVKKPSRPGIKAKAMLCVDCSSNEVRLAENSAAPLPIASLTKLLTAMTVIDEMDLEKVLEVPRDIKRVERHVVGIKPGDMLSVKDLLYGLLVASGNDCAEVLARAYPKGGRQGFLSAMNRRAKEIGATNTALYSPSGLDTKVEGDGKNGSEHTSKIYNTASAEDVALIARHAFTYPLITKISSTKTYTMRTRNPRPKDYRIASNDKLLNRGLPIAGAKTGYTDAAGKCIVALFKDQEKEHLVVLLNTPRHFNAAERVYRWASRTF